MSGFLSRLLHRAGIADAAGEEISLLRYRNPARFEPSGAEPVALEESVESNSVTPAPSTASGARAFAAASDAKAVARPVVQSAIRASADVKAPAAPGGRPVRIPENSIDLDAAPGQSREATVPPGQSMLMLDRRSRFEQPPEASAASARTAAPPALPPTLSPKATGDVDLRALTPHPQPMREREVLPKDLPPSKARQPSVAAPGFRSIETPLAPNAPSPEQTEPQPETIIQIARVEIVASQPEPRRTVAPVSRKPTTSLTDYLARRRR